MDENTRKALRVALGIRVGMLSRQVRHDLWRICEPQHGRAHEALLDALMAEIEEGFEVTKKPMPEADSAAQLYRSFDSSS